MSMNHQKVVGKREFIQHTSKYLKYAEHTGSLLITHQNKLCLKIIAIQPKSINDLKGTLTIIRIKGEINEHILQEYNEW
jgi:antitoxin (DNA-binding transcriptional repressor) of toxin-antitoxin stability system